MAGNDRVVEKYNYLIKLFKTNKIILNRVLRKYIQLNRKYLRLRKETQKTVKELNEKIAENCYQIIFDTKKRIINISADFLKDIEMSKDEFNQSFYIDTLFNNFFPAIDRTKKEINIAPFHFPIMLKNFSSDNEHIHPYVHYQLYGKIKYIPLKRAYYYFINLKDVSSDVELNYIQNTDSVIKSLSISNLFLQQANKKIEVHKIMLIFLICSLIEEYNKETSDHLKRIQDITTILSAECLRMGIIKNVDCDAEEYIKDINYTSPLHDIGKMGVPNYLLSKEGELTPDEWKVMATHTIIGAGYIKKIIDFLKKDPNYSSYTKFLLIPYDICLYHHERWDGGGYPDGLKGEFIPISARIVSVADTYDAIRGNRSYTVSKSHKQACDIIVKESGKQFDPKVVEAFINIQDELEDIQY